MSSGSKSKEERDSLLPIEPGAGFGELGQLFVRAPPVERLFAGGQWFERSLGRERVFVGHYFSLARRFLSSIFAFSKAIATPISARGVAIAEAARVTRSATATRHFKRRVALPANVLKTLSSTIDAKSLAKRKTGVTRLTTSSAVAPLLAPLNCRK
jgi:hypothetical protein